MVAPNDLARIAFAKKWLDAHTIEFGPSALYAFRKEAGVDKWDATDPKTAFQWYANGFQLPEGANFKLPTINWRAARIRLRRADLLQVYPTEHLPESEEEEVFYKFEQVPIEFYGSDYFRALIAIANGDDDALANSALRILSAIYKQGLLGISPIATEPESTDATGATGGKGLSEQQQQYAAAVARIEAEIGRLEKEAEELEAAQTRYEEAKRGALAGMLQKGLTPQQFDALAKTAADNSKWAKGPKATRYRTLAESRKQKAKLFELEAEKSNTPPNSWRFQFSRALLKDYESHIVKFRKGLKQKHQEKVPDHLPRAFVDLFDSGTRLIDGASPEAQVSPVPFPSKSKGATTADKDYNAAWEAYRVAIGLAQIENSLKILKSQGKSVAAFRSTNEVLRRATALQNELAKIRSKEVPDSRKFFPNRTLDFLEAIVDVAAEKDQLPVEETPKGIALSSALESILEFLWNARWTRRTSPVHVLQEAFPFPAETPNQDKTYGQLLRTFNRSKLAYLAERTDYDYSFNILIVGDSGVGKTSLILRYADGVFIEGYISTIGVDFKVKNLVIDGTRVKLKFWDTAGQERFRAITSSYYSRSSAIIVAYDVNNRESFEHVIGKSQDDPDTWLNEIKRYGTAGTPRFLVGTKIDLYDQSGSNDNAEESAVPFDTAKEAAQALELPYFETSAKENTGVDELFKAVAKQLVASAKAAELAARSKPKEDTHRRVVDTVTEKPIDRRVATVGTPLRQTAPAQDTDTTPSRRFDFFTLIKPSTREFTEPPEPKEAPATQAFDPNNFWYYGPVGTNGFSKADDEKHFRYSRGLEKVQATNPWIPQAREYL